MKKVFFLIGLLITFGAKAAPQPQPKLTDTRLLNAAYTFHTCIVTKTTSTMRTFSHQKFKNGADAEGWVWMNVFDGCVKVLTSNETEGMVYQNYKGRLNEMLAFRDGLVWSARAYVLNVVNDAWAKSGRD